MTEFLMGISRKRARKEFLRNFQLEINNSVENGTEFDQR